MKLTTCPKCLGIMIATTPTWYCPQCGYREYQEALKYYPDIEKE